MSPSRAVLLHRRGAAGRGESFSPSSLASLTAWYKADGTLWQDAGRTTPASADGDLVGSWDDASASGLHISQAGTARPTLKTNIVNGKPVLRFDGTNDQLGRSVAMTALFAAAEASIFIVMSQDSTQANNTPVAWNATTTTNRVLTHATFADTVYWDFIDATATSGRVSVAQPSGWDNAFHLTALMRSDSSQVIRVDRAQLVSQDPTATTLSAATAVWSIGNTGSGADMFFKGDIAEVIVCNASLATTDRDNVESYLRTKYATP